MSIDTKLSLEDKIRFFVKGWSNSRRIGRVVRTNLKESILCSFTKPIGKIKRQYESFFWGESCIELDNLGIQCDGSTHFITVFNIRPQNEIFFVNNQYINIAEEVLMSLDLSKVAKRRLSTTAEKVDTLKEANWFNAQRKEKVINFEQFITDNISMYYLCESGELVSWARAIKVDRAIIIDDVHTKVNYRRRGLSNNIMQQIISDSLNDNNVDIIVLAASTLGEKLYRGLGFKHEAFISVYSS